MSSTGTLSFINNSMTNICLSLLAVGTEAFVPELEGELIMAPPPSHDIRGAMATAGVPFQPFKAGATPASCSISNRLS